MVTDRDRSVVQWVAIIGAVSAQDVMARFGVGRTVGYRRLRALVDHGLLAIRHEDGTEVEIGPSEAYVIEPGHDAWVVGDERFLGFEFGVAGGGGIREGLERASRGADAGLTVATDEGRWSGLGVELTTVRPIGGTDARSRTA